MPITSRTYDVGHPTWLAPHRSPANLLHVRTGRTPHPPSSLCEHACIPSAWSYTAGPSGAQPCTHHHRGRRTGDVVRTVRRLCVRLGQPVRGPCPQRPPPGLRATCEQPLTRASHHRRRANACTPSMAQIPCARACARRLGPTTLPRPAGAAHSSLTFRSPHIWCRCSPWSCHTTASRWLARRRPMARSARCSTTRHSSRSERSQPISAPT